MRFQPCFGTISASNFRENPVLSTGRSSRASGGFGRLRAAVAALVLALTAAVPLIATARGPQDDGSALTLQALPTEAQTTHRLIRKGGPFPYSKDGIVFGNRERLLPRQSRGYYREYTVPTPGSRDRGPRRIVCGGEVPTAPEACYYCLLYTSDAADE